MKPLVAAPKVSHSFSQGYALWRANREQFSIIGLLLTYFKTLCCCVRFLLGPALEVGALGQALAGLRGEKTYIGNVFLGFRKFWHMLVTMLVIWLVVSLAPLIAFGIQELLELVVYQGREYAHLDDYTLTTFWILFSPFVVVPIFIGHAMTKVAVCVAAEGGTFGEVFCAPWKALANKNFWSFFCVVTIATLVGFSGIFLFGIGIVITMPIGLCMIASGWNTAVGGNVSENT